MQSFYLPPEKWREPFVLEGSEARHLVRVKRAKPGRKLRLFDGHGREGVFTLVGHAPDQARLSLESQRQRPRPKPEVHLALGWNKSSRRGWLLEKSVELGVAVLVFWQAARSQGRVPLAPKEAWHERCVAAAKQCGRPWLPRLETLDCGAQGLIEHYDCVSHRALLWEGQDAGTLFDPAALCHASSMVLVLGPEGGLTDHETSLLIRAGFTPWSLGKTVLRWETAALLCLGLLYWQKERSGREAVEHSDRNEQA